MIYYSQMFHIEKNLDYVNYVTSLYALQDFHTLNSIFFVLFQDSL